MEDEIQKIGKTQIRPYISKLYEIALDVKSKEKGITVGKLLDSLLANDESLKPYIEKVKELYSY